MQAVELRLSHEGYARQRMLGDEQTTNDDIENKIRIDLLQVVEACRLLISCTFDQFVISRGSPIASRAGIAVKNSRSRDGMNISCQPPSWRREIVAAHIKA